MYKITKSSCLLKKFYKGYCEVTISSQSILDINYININTKNIKF